MAVTDAYATAAQYRTVTGKTDTASDAQILTDLTAISRYLEGRLGRFFTKDAADVTRYFDVPPNTGGGLLITDLSAAPTTVKVGYPGATFSTITALVADTDYEMYPLDAALGPEPGPFTRIVPLVGSFGWGQRIQVVGKFGWPSVPAAITAATIALAAIYRLESPRATSRIDEMGATIDASPEARGIINKLLDTYRRGATSLFA